jgi:hypothetical protein
MESKMTKRTFRVEQAFEYGIGNGVNGAGRRPKITGFYVIENETGRKVIGVTASSMKPAAVDWARNKAEQHLDRISRMYA